MLRYNGRRGRRIRLEYRLGEEGSRDALLDRNQATRTISLVSFIYLDEGLRKILCKILSDVFTFEGAGSTGGAGRGLWDNGAGLPGQSKLYNILH